jgi:predicted nucleic acid-binding Zn ribbon protein
MLDAMSKRHVAHDDDEWSDDGPEDWEDPDESDQDDEQETQTAECPYCGKEIFAHAELCPHCKNYISHEDAPHRRPAKWIIIGVILALAAVAVWVLCR